jgi:DNA polymerase III delta prime subunit
MLMSEIALHPASAQMLRVRTANLPQSLLLSGETGVGLYTVASRFFAMPVIATIFPRAANGDIDATNGTIGVEAIRGLYDQTRTKQTRSVMVLIDDADKMSRGAQAAFLKLLEEPNPNIHFVLTSHTPKRLLPTILSRVQQINIRAVTAKQTDTFIQQQHISDPAKQAQLRFIAEGLPAELYRLVHDDDYFRHRAGVMTDAKAFIQSSPYEKLRIVSQYQTDRGRALQLVTSALLIAGRSLRARPQTVLVKQIDTLLDISECIESNHNVRLQLSRIVL